MTKSSPDSVVDNRGDTSKAEPRNKDLNYHTASSASEDSDELLVVQPSFDDQWAADGSRSPRDRQSRSPDSGNHEGDSEMRNPSSPDENPQRRGSHMRNLSALLGATGINDDVADPEQVVGLDAEFAGRKHKRIYSNGVSHPNHAHRRIDSGGQIEPVARRHHHRENSEGLEILSMAVKGQIEAAAAAAANARSGAEVWDRENQNSRSSLGHVSSTSSSYSQAPPGYGHPSGRSPPPPRTLHHPMEPPPHRLRGHYPPQHIPHLGAYAPHYPPAHGPSGYHSYPPPPPPYSSSYYHYGASGPVHPYPPPGPYSQRHAEYYGRQHEMDDDHYDQPAPVAPAGWEARQRSTSNPENTKAPSNTTEVKTDKTVVRQNSSKKDFTNTDPTDPPVPAEVGHHRKLSSFSSLGSIFGSSSIFPGSGSDPDQAKPSEKGHRKNSSSVSFALDIGPDDENFLRNLQAANACAASSFRSSPPPFRSSPPPYRGSPPTISQPTKTDPLPPRRSPPPQHLPPLPPLQHAMPVPAGHHMALAMPGDLGEGDSDSPSSSPTGMQLAPGGTSKRVRRKCTVSGCPNRVVQGGLCITHGAKRKTCKHPGCTKNVKKAGLCSTHGPARKRCEHPDCPKVAVQGGRCIAHGAKKKLCSIQDCTKQAILSGMCKKHHDQEQLRKKNGEGEFCRPVADAFKKSHKPTHTRGLSIFQEMSADAVSSLLNESGASSKLSGDIVPKLF